MCGAIGEYRRIEGVRIIWGALSEIGYLEELGIDKMKLFTMIFKK